MKDKKMNGVQLYYNIGPLSACFMIGGGLVIDTYLQNGVSLFAADLSSTVMVRVPCPVRGRAPSSPSSDVRVGSIRRDGGERARRGS